MKNLVFTALLAFCGFATTAQQSISYKSPEQKLNDEFCSGSFKSTDGTIIDLRDNPSAGSYLNILDWLQGRVAGLQVYTARNGTKIPFIRNQQTSIYVDEMPVSPGALDLFPSQDIAMIKVIKTPFLGGFDGAGGAIAIYTVRGDEEADGETRG